ncbi:LOW QUALITY PROTEIN: hypothetical protein Dda_7608 [Drechslerella dactyloides]|uniref:Uncharacterized protein n=1 Tax=Drechslerella dactyloides TaxID=74499 RepID=A0AAD6ISI9_DREDA|nr:LOW QUALITY PROTEIN: hypothetical protein Dda_7608 [Drechslerella dactyloides]
MGDRNLLSGSFKKIASLLAVPGLLPPFLSTIIIIDARSAVAYALLTVVGLATAATITEPPNGAGSAPAVPTDPILLCIKKCNDGDVTCQAQCQGLPTPDEAAVDATHDCVAACPSSSGSDADNAAWAACQQKCVTNLYYTASNGPPKAAPTGPAAAASSAASNGNNNAQTTGPNGAKPTGNSGSNNRGSGSGDSSNPSGSGGSNSDAASTSGSGNSTANANANAGSSVSTNLSMLGALGLFLGALML